MFTFEVLYSQLWALKTVFHKLPSNTSKNILSKQRIISFLHGNKCSLFILLIILVDLFTMFVFKAVFTALGVEKRWNLVKEGVGCLRE